MISAVKSYLRDKKRRLSLANQLNALPRLEETQRFFFIKGLLKHGHCIDNIPAGCVTGKELCRPEEIGSKLEVISAYQDLHCMLPSVYGIIDKQRIFFKVPERCIYNFKDANVLSGSDVVISGDKVYWDKFFFPNMNKNYPQDYHFAGVEGSTIQILPPPRQMVVENAISLMGVHANHWAHFLCEQFEKLDHITRLPVAANNLSILVQKGIDPHILHLVNDKVAHLGCDIIEVCPSMMVSCRNFYHIDRGSILTDHGDYTSVNDILIRPEVSKYVRSLSQGIGKQDLKIFIGRGGGRTVTNYDEIRDYFMEQGFLEVFPHEISITEKMEIFGRASHIAGPGSSGFANAVFCQDNTKIVFFINYARIFDMLLSGLLRDYQISCWHLTGTDEDKASINSNYYLPLQKVKSFVADTAFLA